MSIRTILALAVLSVVAMPSGALAQQACWKCTLIYGGEHVVCDEADVGGHKDCDENMSMTRCSVSGYEPCDPGETFAGADGVVTPLGVEGAKEGVRFAIGQAEGNMRACSGIVVRRVRTAEYVARVYRDTERFSL